jgi:hypothetical protein
MEATTDAADEGPLQAVLVLEGVVMVLAGLAVVIAFCSPTSGDIRAVHC